MACPTSPSPRDSQGRVEPSPVPQLFLDLKDPRSLQPGTKISVEFRSLSESAPSVEWGDFELVESWEPTTAGELPTEFLRRGGEFCLRRQDLGWAEFGRGRDSVVATAVRGATTEVLEAVFRAEWLPPIFAALGYQVLHASGVVHLNSGRVVGFCGPSGAGKSTMAAAMGRLSGWRQLADDVLAFMVDAGVVSLVRIPDARHLRTPSAEFLGEEAEVRRPLRWPDLELDLSQIYFLSPEEHDGAISVRIEEVRKVLAFERLLAQAFTVSVRPRDLRQRMVEDYIELAASLDFYELGYTKRLEAVDAAVSAVVTSAEPSGVT